MIIVAIDGPSGAGKGTLSRYLAQKLDFFSLESGLLYRHAALFSLEKNINIQMLSEEDITHIAHFIDGLPIDALEGDPRLRLENTANIASQLGTYPAIRTCVNQWLHNACTHLSGLFKGVIIDGRDIGTVVFPNAACKLFVTADEEIRVARRRQEESHHHVETHMLTRDQRDKGRKCAPLLPAEDAFVLDTSRLSIDEACQRALNYTTKYCMECLLAGP